MTKLSSARIAIVHSWLNQYGGAERVLEDLHNLFPAAPVYTSMFDPRAFPPFYRQWDVRTSFLQRVPFSRSHHQYMLFLYPWAFESLDLSGYDLVFSLSSGFAHGARAGRGSHHVSYCLTPPRFIWTFRDYARLERVGVPARVFLATLVPWLRTWDRRASRHIDEFVAISDVVRERIRRHYGRESALIYPATHVDTYTPSDGYDDYYLSVSRLIPYKRVDLAIEACNRLKLPLKVVGGGRSQPLLEKMAGPTIEFVGRVDDRTLRQLYARCKALIFPAEEDLGLTPIEAQASGRPVIAYGRGGSRETVADGVSGILFAEQTADSLVDVLERFDPSTYDPVAIRQRVRDIFDISVFRRRLTEYLEALL